MTTAFFHRIVAAICTYSIPQTTRINTIYTIMMIVNCAMNSPRDSRCHCFIATVVQTASFCTTRRGVSDGTPPDRPRHCRTLQLIMEQHCVSAAIHDAAEAVLRRVLHTNTFNSELLP